MLDQALKSAKSVDPEAFQVEACSNAGKKYLPCLSCGSCEKLGYYVRSKGDDFDELRDKWLEADGVIIAIPVFHMSVPGHLKCFIDRLGNSLWSHYGGPGKHLKVYGAIAQGLHIFSGQENAITEIINHALTMGNIVVSGDASDSYIGCGAWTENKVAKDALETLYGENSIDAEVAVNASRTLGKRVAELALILKTGALSYIDYLSSDPGLAGNCQIEHCANRTLETMCQQKKENGKLKIRLYRAGVFDFQLGLGSLSTPILCLS